MDTPMDTHEHGVRRREVLQRAGSLGLLAALGRFAPAYARTDARSAALRAQQVAEATDTAAGERVIDLTIEAFPFQVNGRVGNAVAQLGDADREVLLMRHAEELPYEEIACLLEIEPAAARKRYGRALLRLQNILTEHGLLE